MKTDRELLELAARAAGYAVDCGFDGCPLIYGSDAGPDGPREWNPLTDDDDALRLAVKLKMNVCLAGLPHVYADMPGCDFVTDACYRRAIVRAAAAIGEQMQRKQSNKRGGSCLRRKWKL